MDRFLIRRIDALRWLAFIVFVPLVVLAWWIQGASATRNAVFIPKQIHTPCATDVTASVNAGDGNVCVCVCF